MGSRGPLPHPAKVQRLKGNPGKRQLMQPAPQDAGVPSLPSSLGDAGRVLWQELIEELRNRKTLIRGDKRILEMACLSYQEMRAAADVIETQGTTYESQTVGGGRILRPRPEVAQRADAHRRFMKCLDSLALTPSSRARLQINAIPERESDDPLGDFLRENPHPTYQEEGE